MDTIDVLRVPLDTLDSSRLSMAELKAEMAVHLYSTSLSARRANWPRRHCGNSASYWLHATSHPTTMKPIWNRIQPRCARWDNDDRRQQHATIMTFQTTTSLNINAQEAQRLVNQQVVTELRTGLIARDPELITYGERVAWRVPIVLSLPSLGDLGHVGMVDVDAESGDLLVNTNEQERIIQRTRRLYTDSTLQTE